MRLAANPQAIEELKNKIKDRFAEFNRRSSPSRGRRYPAELRELIHQGSTSGIRQIDLKRLSGMSQTAIKCILAKAKPAKARRLEVVASPAAAERTHRSLLIRLPSGISIELSDPSLLPAALQAAFAHGEVKHVASR